MLGFDVLDPQLDLLSDHFVEASAGTGKTFAIENLVSRLIHEKGLRLDEILVVTFTRAATFELKSRIRNKVESSDEEKIFTIHSFCFHTLREHAFDSGITLDQIEENASNEHLKRVAKDYLRTCVIHPKQLEIVLRSHQNDFDGLISHLVSVAKQRIPIETTSPKPLPEFDSEKLFDDLMAQAPLYGKMCNRQKEIKNEIIEGFRRLIAGDLFDTPLPLMVEENKLKRTYELHLYYPDLLPKLIECARSISDPLILFANLAEEIRRKIEEVIEQNELLFFEDLISLMEKNVQNETFAKKVRSQYKAVLIDEFQDTDPHQWNIFKTLFLGHLPLYLVGDPKQAIYRFRRADLYTYMRAKKEVGHVSVLEKNFRSTPALIDVLNQLFSQTIFELPITNEHLDYYPVKAGEEKQNLMPPVYLLSAKDEKELFKRVVEQIDLSLTTAVLVKDRFQAQRFKEYCPFPTRLAKGRTLSPGAFKALEDLLIATLDPHNHDAARLVVLGLFQDLKQEDFIHYHHLLQEKNLLTFFKKIISLSGVSLVHIGGEELYLDLLQLVEIMTQESLPIESYLPYLQDLAASDEERRKAYSEKKEGSVLVMTTHASKGLEFDVVFPIGLALPKTKNEGLVYSFEKKMLTLFDPHHEQEVDAELIRQIYVAFTRAKKRLYIPIIEKRASPLSKFMKGINHSIEEAPRQEIKKFIPSEKALIKPPNLNISFPSCPIQSFSSIATYTHKNKEVSSEIPAGAEVGVLLHHILETTDFANIDEKVIYNKLYQTQLASHTDWVIEMVKQTASMLLPASEPFALKDVDPNKMVHEFEFLYQAENAYMKGFIDLFFEHNERYYIIDWKSNLITDSIECEMERHNYYLQAQIYKNAIQKYTALFGKQSLDAVFYIFLRENKVSIIK